MRESFYGSLAWRTNSCGNGEQQHLPSESHRLRSSYTHTLKSGGFLSNPKSAAPIAKSLEGDVREPLQGPKPQSSAGGAAPAAAAVLRRVRVEMRPVSASATEASDKGVGARGGRFWRSSPGGHRENRSESGVGRAPFPVNLLIFAGQERSNSDDFTC